MVAESAYHQTVTIVKEKRALLDQIQHQEDISDKKEKQVSSKGVLDKMASIFGGSKSSGKKRNMR